MCYDAGQVFVQYLRIVLGLALAGCSVDVSNLRAPSREDAQASDALAAGRTDGAGGSGGAKTDGSSSVGGTDGDGGARPDGATLALDTVTTADVGEDVDGVLDGAPEVAADGTLDGALEVVEDSAVAPDDSAGADRPVYSVDGGADDAADDDAAPEVGAADARDLGPDGPETGGKDGGDAGCRGDDCVPFIVPSFPAAMKCSLDGSPTELGWSSLSTWNPTRDSRVCGSAGAYYVEGKIVSFQSGLRVLADVYAPEDSTWHPISGGPMVQPDAAGGFEGYFCLPQKGLDRTFRFRIVRSTTSQEVGVTCLIHVTPP